MLSTARIFLILGVVFIFIGGVLFLIVRTGIPIGRLPGDIYVQRENFSCVFALGTSILLSILLTLILNLILRNLNK
jgi:hypothetical protein